LSSSSASALKFCCSPPCFFFQVILIDMTAAPTQIGLRANAITAYYQQITTPPTIETTIIRIVSARVPINSEDKPFN
jgi:hypothetical protein